MAKIALDLTQFKSAGVYTVEIDNSERIVVTTQSLRLVPGFSAQGPFNTPVFIRSTRDLEKFYGVTDPKLEKKGSFFHRSIQTCLLTAPVFAINLLKVNTIDATLNTDTVDLIAFGLNSNSTLNTGDSDTVESDLFVNFFNRQRFWTPDTDYLQGVVVNKYGSGDMYNAPLLQIVNTGTKDISFIVRKAQGLTQYSVYAIDWYGGPGNIPYEWIRPYDYVKDYFIQIVAIEGDWTDYGRLSTDPYYSQFFNANGVIPTQLTNFMNSSQINLIGSWTGCIIPEFKDQTGSEQFIESVINAGTSITGIMVNVNQQALEELNWNTDTMSWVLGEAATPAPFQVDLVGHNLIDQTTIDTQFLSYDISVADVVLHTTEVLVALDSTGRSFSLPNAGTGIYTKITVGTLIEKSTAAGEIPGVTYVTQKYFNGTNYVIATAEAVDAGTRIIQKPIDDASIATAYKFKKLDGLHLGYRHLPGYDELGARNAEEGVEKIYGMLFDGGILRGLTNKDMIDYRYIVDTMAFGLRSEMGGKSYLSKLAKAKGKCTAIISAPSISQFAASHNPYFCDTFVSGVDPVPVFSTEWIPEGGNPDMPRDFRFTFPNEENGAKYAGIFGPFLRYNEGGKLINVPPAPDVANAYVRKFLGGDPFAIVANKNGILANSNLAGVEYMIDKVDRDYLEPFGYNSIIERASTGQIMIYCNTTAYQTVKSDFNNLHVRELLNTIEIQVEEVLKDYIFDFNNPVTRLNIINSVSPILETIKDAGALTNYDIVMDETNNTEELIAEGFGIIDIGVWVTGALTKIVNRITVNTNAGISTGGFIY
jgi:hypothetical protein